MAVVDLSELLNQISSPSKGKKSAPGTQDIPAETHPVTKRRRRSGSPDSEVLWYLKDDSSIPDDLGADSIEEPVVNATPWWKTADSPEQSRVRSVTSPTTTSSTTFASSATSTFTSSRNRTFQSRGSQSSAIRQGVSQFDTAQEQVLAPVTRRRRYSRTGNDRFSRLVGAQEADALSDTLISGSSQDSDLGSTAFAKTNVRVPADEHKATSGLGRRRGQGRRYGNRAGQSPSQDETGEVRYSSFQGRRVRAEDRDDSVKNAFNEMIRLLTRREYSASDLLDKCKQSFTPEACDQALAKCQELNYQSDERYAQMLVRHMQYSHYGPQKLRFEAMRHGVDSTLIENSSEEVDWNELAYECLCKKYHPGKRLEYKEKVKASAFLARRGFDGASRSYAFDRLEQSVDDDRFDPDFDC